MNNQCLYFQIVKELYFLAERVYGIFIKETLSDPLARITSENVRQDIEQRNYFSFHAYEYYLDVSSQYELMRDVKSLDAGLEESYNWYVKNKDKVNKKPYIEYIDNNLV